MGVWGSGLYSGDFATDLRSTISAVSRLPFDNEKLVDILCETEPAAATKPDHPDHTTFWLVLADQFAKRAIVSDRARDKALAIIDTGSDLALLEKLGMTPSDRKKRSKMLAQLRTQLVAPIAAGKPRPVLKNPQPLIMEVGDVIAYPTFDGKCINPYYASKELDNKHWSKEEGRAVAWKQNGWSACFIVERGRAFDFLSWYWPLTVTEATPEKPTLASLRGVTWKLSRPGTCSALHFRRMELEKLGTLPIDREKLLRLFPGIKPAISAAVNDISIANSLNIRPPTSRQPAIPTLDEIL